MLIPEGWGFVRAVGMAKPLSALNRKACRRAKAKISQPTNIIGPIYGDIDLNIGISTLQRIDLPPTYLKTSQPINQSINLPIYQSICLSIYESTDLSIYRPTDPCMGLVIKLSIYLCIDLQMNHINLCVLSPDQISMNHSANL